MGGASSQKLSLGEGYYPLRGSLHVNLGNNNPYCCSHAKVEINIPLQYSTGPLAPLNNGALAPSGPP